METTIRLMWRKLTPSQKNKLKKLKFNWKFPYNAENRAIQEVARFSYRINLALYNWIKNHKNAFTFSVREDNYEDLEQYLQAYSYRVLHGTNRDRKELSALLTSILLLIWKHNGNELDRWASRVMLPELSKPDMINVIDSYIQQFMKTINDEIEKLYKSIRVIVQNGYDKRWTPSRIQNALIDKLNGFADRRMKLLAVNLVSNFNALVQKEFLTTNGLTNYTWETMRDEKVRHIHAMLDDSVCSWANPDIYSNDGVTWELRTSDMEIGKHPGEAVNCRCTATPFIGNIL